MAYLPSEKRYDAMQYRRSGRSGLKLPAISLGLWHNFGHNARADAMWAMCRRAFDLGITHFDLANNYGPPPGAAEEWFGEAISTEFKPYRDELVISTKAGYNMWPGPYGEWGSRKYLLSSLDQSLKRMRLDYVDIFYSHRFDPDTPLEETMGALDAAVRQGKALYVGVSSYSSARTAEAAAILRGLGTPAIIHQPSYSILNRWTEEDELLDTLDKEGMGCISFSPLAQGLLTDKYLKGVPADSRAKSGSGAWNDKFLDDKNLACVRALNDMAKGRGQTLAQMALAWVLRDPRMTSALIGASKVEQIEDAVGALANLAFTQAELDEIDNRAHDAGINLWEALEHSVTTAKKLRSARWFGADDLRAFGHRSRTLQMGYAYEDFMGKPVVAIINTWSDLQPCHAHFRTRAEEVKRGVWQAGGFPVELPALSLSETFVKPTTMLYRNLLALEAEELLRSHPVDGVVLMGGCDKTTPALIMGALSMNLPAIFLPAGPMLRGNYAGKILGSGSDVWKYWAEKQAGALSDAEWQAMESGIARSYGTCMTMGTASTMAALTETLGLTLPGASSIPASDMNHPRMATECGRRIVAMIAEDLKPRDVLSRASFENALVVQMALAGSTNAMVHLIAMAGRAGIALDLADFDRVARTVPVLANLRPSGQYLMEDFFYAGGTPGLLSMLADKLDLGARTVAGGTLGDAIAGAKVYNADVIRPLSDPVSTAVGTAVLTGNLAPGGAVMKPSAADPRLLKHRGPALVFRDYNEMAAEVDRDDLDVTADHVLVLQNAGPVGGPGMPEWGMLPIPKKLLKQGVRDMLRISDGRMSGTSYGACILHVAPESYIGGPLAAVRTGDMIAVDVEARTITLEVPDDEIAARLAAWVPPDRTFERGYNKIYAAHIRQADKGCDFDFLEGTAPTPEPEIH